MDRAQLIALYTQDQRKNVEYPATRREVTSTVIRHVDLSENGEGMVIYSELDESNADQVIREQISYFEGLGQSFEWKWYDYDQPPDLRERLAAHGFDVEEAEAIMVLDLEHAPPLLLWQPVQHMIERVTDPEELVDLQAIQQQVWEEDMSWLAGYLGDSLRQNPEQMSVYVAYVDGQPASAAWIYFPQRSLFASLWGGSTVSRFRKRGLYTALLAARAQEARQRQVRFLTVDASEMSRPILEKFGFQWIAWSRPCKWEYKSP
jgi:GNAT superfamily N-acetyltransferase